MKKTNRRKKARVGGSGSVEERRFRSCFGVDSLICAVAWEWLTWKGTIPKGGTMEHFLWGCFMLMVYPSENVMSEILDADEKSVRKWSWLFFLALEDLMCDVVSNFYLLVYC